MAAKSAKRGANHARGSAFLSPHRTAETAADARLQSLQAQIDEHVRRLVSYFLLQALKEKRDGILPLTPGAMHLGLLAQCRQDGVESVRQMADDLGVALLIPKKSPGWYRALKVS